MIAWLCKPHALRPTYGRITCNTRPNSILTLPAGRSGSGGCTGFDKVLTSRYTEKQVSDGSSFRHHCASSRFLVRHSADQNVATPR